MPLILKVLVLDDVKIAVRLYSTNAICAAKEASTDPNFEETKFSIDANFPARKSSTAPIFRTLQIV